MIARLLFNPRQRDLIFIVKMTKNSEKCHYYYDIQRRNSYAAMEYFRYKYWTLHRDVISGGRVGGYILWEVGRITEQYGTWEFTV